MFARSLLRQTTTTTKTILRRRLLSTAETTSTPPTKPGLWKSAEFWGDNTAREKIFLALIITDIIISF